MERKKLFYIIASAVFVLLSASLLSASLLSSCANLISQDAGGEGNITINLEAPSGRGAGQLTAQKFLTSKMPPQVTACT